MEQPEIVQAPAQQPAQKPWWKRVEIRLAILVAILLGLAGSVHIVHGSESGVCWKDGWSVSDTIIDVDDYIDKPVIDLMDKMKVIRALEKCGMITRHHRSDR